MKKILMLLATFLFVCGTNAQTVEELREKFTDCYVNQDWEGFKEVQEFINKKMPDSKLAIQALVYEADFLFRLHKYEESEKAYMSLFLSRQNTGIRGGKLECLRRAAFCAFRKAEVGGFDKQDTDHAIQLYT